MSALKNPDLWHRLEGHSIGPPDAAFSFAARLARENRWTIEHAERAVLEYKRFCYLACTAPHQVTPSDAVDQVWHLHLTFSRDYWGEFCPEVLRMDLHHGPTAGGEAERTRYYDQYARTFASYEEAFGKPPPADLWPSAGRRFGKDPLAFRVNPKDVMVLDKRMALLGALGWIALGAAATFLIGSIL